MARKGGEGGGSKASRDGDEPIILDIESKCRELENSHILAALLKEFKKRENPPLGIRFLAVGNFGLENKNAEYQTALALLLSERYRWQEFSAWDPNFKKRDLRVLSQLGISVREADPPAAATQRLLWFAPHAPYFLEPQLLRRVGKSIYIGNDLTLTNRDSMRDAKECEWYKDNASIMPIAVKPKDPWREAFKNTAIHQLN